MKLKAYFIISSLLALIVVATGFSCKKSATEKNETAGVEKKNTSLLWEISGKDLQQPSYLYGTIHLIAKKDFVIRPLIDSMFAKSAVAAFEFKLDDMSALMQAQKDLKLPEGQTLQDFMSPADYEKLKKYLNDSLQADIAEYNTQKPLALYQAMASDYINGEQESFEVHFLMEAMQSKKPIEGLETIGDQLHVFDSVPYTEQLQWIMDGIDSADTYQQIWNDLVAAYKAEDLEKLSELMEKSSPELMKYRDLFINDRNRKWIPVIEKLIHEKQTFIAVGAGHLPGDNGIINLLKKQGYTVKPI